MELMRVESIEKYVEVPTRVKKAYQRWNSIVTNIGL